MPFEFFVKVSKTTYMFFITLQLKKKKNDFEKSALSTKT